MILLLRDFLLNPGTVCSIKKLSWINFLYLFLIEFVILTIVTGISQHFFGSFSVIFEYHIQEIKEYIFIFLILAVIIFPIYEELLHRYYLNHQYKSLFISAILLLIHYFLTFDQQNPLLNAIHFMGFLYVTVILILKEAYGLINMKLMIWGSILFFGLFHLGNYESEIYTNNFILIFILVIPQFIGGFFMAFMRIRYGLLHSILYHGFFNLVITILGLLEYSFFPENYDTSINFFGYIDFMV